MGFFQLYQGAIDKEHQTFSEPPPLPMHTMQTKRTVRKAKVPKPNSEWVHQCAMAQWTKDQNAPDMKWTSRKPLTWAEVFNVVKPHHHHGPTYSGYVNMLPWGSYNLDSTPQSHSPSMDAKSSVINTGAQNVLTLDKQDYPHHFCHPPLQQYFGQDHKVYADHVPSNDYVPAPPLMILAMAQVLCKNNSTCFGCLWCLWLSLSCFGSIWLDVKIWKNAEKS